MSYRLREQVMAFRFVGLGSFRVCGLYWMLHGGYLGVAAECKGFRELGFRAQGLGLRD